MLLIFSLLKGKDSLSLRENVLNGFTTQKMSSSTILVNLIPNTSGSPTFNIVGDYSVGTLVVPVKAKMEALKSDAKMYIADSEDEIKVNTDVELQAGIYKLLVTSKDHIEYYPVKLTYSIDPYPTAFNQLMIGLDILGLRPVGVTEFSGMLKKNFFFCLKEYIARSTPPPVQQSLPPPESNSKEVLERLANIQSLLKDLQESKKTPPPDLGEITQSIQRSFEDLKKTQKSEEILETLKQTSSKESLRPDDISDAVKKALSTVQLQSTLKSDEVVSCVRKCLSEDLSKIGKPDMKEVVDELRRMFNEEKKQIDYTPILTEIRSLASADRQKLQKEIDSHKEMLFKLEREKVELHKFLQEAEDYIQEFQQIS